MLRVLFPASLLCYASTSTSTQACCAIITSSYASGTAHCKLAVLCWHLSMEVIVARQPFDTACCAMSARACCLLCLRNVLCYVKTLQCCVNTYLRSCDSMSLQGCCAVPNTCLLCYINASLLCRQPQRAHTHRPAKAAALEADSAATPQRAQGHGAVQSPTLAPRPVELPLDYQHTELGYQQAADLPLPPALAGNSWVAWTPP